MIILKNLEINFRIISEHGYLIEIRLLKFGGYILLFFLNFFYILIFEFIITPLLISLQPMFKFSFYLILGVQTLILIFIIIFPLYPTKV